MTKIIGTDHDEDEPEGVVIEIDMSEVREAMAIFDAIDKEAAPPTIYDTLLLDLIRRQLDGNLKLAERVATLERLMAKYIEAFKVETEMLKEVLEAAKRKLEQ